MDDDTNVALIHREALQRLFPPSTSDVAPSDETTKDPSISMLEDLLVMLRKQRCQAQANLRQLEFDQRLRPLKAELTVDHQTTGDDDVLAYQHVLDAPLIVEANPSKDIADTPDEEETVVAADADSELSSQQPTTSLAERMHHLRKRRRIVGSHRISGVSILPTPTDRNVLGVRLDICIRGGVYAAKHFLFFDICTAISSASDDSDDEDSDASKDTDELIDNNAPLKQYYLRLNQHTVPTSVSLPTLIQRHFGGHTRLALPEGSSLVTDNTNVMATVRLLVGDIHDACHAYAVRKEGVEFLSKHVVSSSSSNHTPRHTNHNFCVSELTFPDSYRHVEFTLSWEIPPNGDHDGRFRKLVVELEFGEESNPKPTNVEVTTAEENGSEDDALKHKSIMVLCSMPLWCLFAGLQGGS